MKEEPGRNLTAPKPAQPKSPQKGKSNSDFAVQMVQAVQADPEDKEVEKLMFKEAIQQGHSSVDLAFMELDTDKDGKISRDEWVAKFGDDAAMVEMFDVYDADGSGFVDADEFKNGHSEHGAAMQVFEEKKAKAAECAEAAPGECDEAPAAECDGVPAAECDEVPAAECDEVPAQEEAPPPMEGPAECDEAAPVAMTKEEMQACFVANEGDANWCGELKDLFSPDDKNADSRRFIDLIDGELSISAGT